MKRWMHCISIILSPGLIYLANLRISHFTAASNGLLDWVCKIPVFAAAIVSGNPHTLGPDLLFYLIEFVYYFIMVEIVIYIIFTILSRRSRPRSE